MFCVNSVGDKMKVRKAKREYAQLLIKMMKDLDGFKINSLNY